MFRNLFRRKGDLSPRAQCPAKGFLQAESASKLLANPRRKKLLEHIWQRTSLSRKQFEQLYLGPVSSYADLVQQLPASENHHHSYPGGMLDHGLEIVAYALKIRQSYLLPVGSPPEAQAAQAEAWSAACAYAALLHDIGKIAVDLEVEQKNGQLWHPWHGPLRQDYRFRYTKGREYKLHNAAAGLVYTQILTPKILDWLSSYKELWSSLVYVLAGQYEHAGILGELVVQADQASVAQELGANPSRAINAPKNSLQRQLVDALRYLLKEELKLNQPEASDGWLTHDGLWLVSKTVSDRLRAYLLSKGIEGIPDKNSAIFNLLQDHAIIQANPEGKAIWKATVISDSGWKNTFTFLRASPALIWSAEERPASFAGSVVMDTEAEQQKDERPPSSIPKDSRSDNPVKGDCREDQEPSHPTKQPVSLGPNLVVQQEDDEVNSLLDLLGFDDDLQASNSSEQSENSDSQCPLLQPSRSALLPSDLPLESVSTSDVVQFGKSEQLNTRQARGKAFMSWLKHGVLTHKIIINDAKAKVHTVAGTAYLVTPEIFRRYVQEHPDVVKEAKEQGSEDWRWVQKCFEKLAIHQKRKDGLNIWTCEVCGPRKSKNLRGYLLKDPTAIFAEMPYDNPAVKLIGTLDSSERREEAHNTV